MPFPSRLEFISLLQYSPRGVSGPSRFSQLVCRGIKDDSFVYRYDEYGRRQPTRVIERSAARLRLEIPKYPFLQKAFGSDSLLVPVPRSAPLKDPKALWPALSICQAIVAEKLALNIAPLLIRTSAVEKAAFASLGKRPSPIDHFRTTKVDARLPLDSYRQIVLVDDVITRGSSFLGMYARLSAAFPEVPIICYAVIRTMSTGKISEIVAPVSGTIVMDGT